MFGWIDYLKSLSSLNHRWLCYPIIQSLTSNIKTQRKSPLYHILIVPIVSHWFSELSDSSFYHLLLLSILLTSILLSVVLIELTFILVTCLAQGHFSHQSLSSNITKSSPLYSLFSTLYHPPLTQLLDSAISFLPHFCFLLLRIRPCAVHSADLGFHRLISILATSVFQSPYPIWFIIFRTYVNI